MKMKIFPRAACLALTCAATFAAAQDLPSETDESYLVRAGDMLSVQVFPQAELGGNFAVNQDGSVVLKTVGSIPVRGKTLGELKVLFEKKLGLYFRKPRVTLGVVQFSRRHVMLTGEVKGPGLIRHEESLTLSELIVRAGGFTDEADRKTVRVFRGPAGAQEVTIVDVDAVIESGDLSKDFAIMPGDRVEVGRRINVVFVWGSIASPGSFDFRPGMKLMDLVTKANGLKPEAKTDKIRIFRVGGKVFTADFKKVLDGDMSRDIVLEAGDIVYVPQLAVVRAGQWIGFLGPILSIMGIITSMIAFGVLL